MPNLVPVPPAAVHTDTDMTDWVLQGTGSATGLGSQPALCTPLAQTITFLYASSTTICGARALCKGREA